MNPPEYQITVVQRGDLHEPSDPLAERAREYVRAAKAPATLRAYRSDWADFETWCRGREVPALPVTPETVAPYLAALAGERRAATFARRLTSIARAHETVGFTSPTTMRHAVVSETMKGIRRVHGSRKCGRRRSSQPTCRRFSPQGGTPARVARPRALARHLLRRFPALRNPAAPHLRPPVAERRSRGNPSPLQDRPAGAGKRGRDPARGARRNLPGARARALDGGGRDRPRNHEPADHLRG